MKLFRNPLKTAGIAGTGLIAAFLFGASPSLAEDDLFATLDANGDGFLTGDETFLLTDLQAQAEIALANIPLPDEYDAADIVSIETANYTDYDTDKDGRFSREEFAAIDGISFEFDGKVGDHQLATNGDTLSTITFFAPQGIAEFDDEATYREALKSGTITWQSKEPGKEVFTITTIIKPDETDVE